MPRSAPNLAEHQLHTYVPHTVADQVTQLAATQGQSVSAWLRRLVFAEIQRAGQAGGGAR